jgi:hypothetical protein
MNHVRLSGTTKELFAAAKADVPTAAARAKVWVGVSGAIGGAAAAGASGVTAGAMLSGGASATKLLAMGALFGGALTVGLAATLLQIGPLPAPPGRTTNPVALAQPAAALATRSATVVSISNVNAAPAPVVSPGQTSASPRISTPVRHAPRHAKSTAHDDSLAREASLVAEARSSLSQGDPRSALRAIRAARALLSRQLVPEELAVEEQALRALGQSDEANGIDVMLRLQYPESALAR